MYGTGCCGEPSGTLGQMTADNLSIYPYPQWLPGWTFSVGGSLQPANPGATWKDLLTGLKSFALAFAIALSTQILKEIFGGTGGSDTYQQAVDAAFANAKNGDPAAYKLLSCWAGEQTYGPELGQGCQPLPGTGQSYAAGKMSELRALGIPVPPVRSGGVLGLSPVILMLGVGVGVWALMRRRD